MIRSFKCKDGITGQEQALTDYKIRAGANGPSLGPDTDTDKILPVDSPPDLLL
jgi:hypothetical protein